MSVQHEVQARLFALQDPSYKAFHCKLIPTVDPAAVIGVRTPALRRLAKAFAQAPESADFLRLLPHRYYEENNLHAFLIEAMRDYDQAIAALDAFLPYVDNWATCDMMSPKVLGAHRDKLLTPVRRWLASDRPYTVRFGIETLMRWYLDDAFDPAYPAAVAAVQSDDYYVNMMIAWYFATALAKQYKAALPYLEQRRLDVWTHNKTIRKAVESRRLSDEQKDRLRKLKIP